MLLLGESILLISFLGGPFAPPAYLPFGVTVFPSRQVSPLLSLKKTDLGKRILRPCLPGLGHVFGHFWHLLQLSRMVF